MQVERPNLSTDHFHLLSTLHAGNKRPLSECYDWLKFLGIPRKSMEAMIKLHLGKFYTSDQMYNIWICDTGKELVLVLFEVSQNPKNYPLFLHAGYRMQCELMEYLREGRDDLRHFTRGCVNKASIYISLDELFHDLF